MLGNHFNRRHVLALSATFPSLFVDSAFAHGIPNRDIDRARSLRNGRLQLRALPQTITSFQSPTSPGGLHDYYSQGDYWWPNPANPSGPYIRRDGISNPNRFDDHRQALIRLSLIVPSLVAAFSVNRDRRFAIAAQRHLDAWFVSPATRMAPHLNHAQAITNVNTGRGVGLIDTLHLVEVARAIKFLEPRFALQNRNAIYAWFAQFVNWMKTSPNGIEERDSVNNHASCYVLQLAAFAQLNNDRETRAWCVDRFKAALVPKQIAPDGKLPLELARTKPFGYCLFNLEVLAALAHLLSTPNDNLWTFKTAQSGSVADVFAFMLPYIMDKSTWTFPRDVEHWNDWPVRHSSLLFAGRALGEPRAIALWQRLNPDPVIPEVIRNFPIRQPRLWL
jgi:Alginate lyase